MRGIGDTLDSAALVETVSMFSTVDEIPERVFFPDVYVAQYKTELLSLIKRVEQVMLTFGAEYTTPAQWNDLQLKSLPKDSVWENLAALQACGLAVNATTELFKQKIRESMGMVATDPVHFGMESAASDHSSEEAESDGDDFPEGFHDVEPVKSKKVARALNDEVIQRVQAVFEDNIDEFENFKHHALQFGTANETAAEFYDYLLSQMTDEQVSSIVIDFARLLPHPTMRIPLLKEHYMHLQGQHKAQERQKSWSNLNRRTQSTAHLLADPETNGNTVQEEVDYDSDDDHIDEFPTTLRLATVNHLMFIIHGIGQHSDFQEGEFKSWDGQVGLEGGNHAFRDIYRTMLETMFRDIPVALELQSIEWHEDLHEPTGVDNVFDLICPEGASGIREFTKETLLDVLYYLSPRYGQLIVDTVTQQLNQKYRVFMEEHPGWDGKISIFAHSLGSVISYDILTHKPGEVSKTGVRFPGLDFQVENFFAVGSPVPIMILSRGDLKLEDGIFTDGIKVPNCARYFNIFHPIDPIAYRVEPLMQKDMHDKAPVQLLAASSLRTVGFAKIQEMLEGITAPVHGFPHRIDYVMRRRKREQGMMELAYATASHSSYWMSEDVVMFTIMQICKPVVEKLHRYMSAQRPLPVLMRNIVELTPHTKVMISSSARIRNLCTGFSYERIVMMDHERLHILPRLNEAVCRRRWSVKLTPQLKAGYGDDSFTLKIVVSDSSGHSNSVPSSSRSSRSSDSEVYHLKAPTTPLRNEWLSMINHTILKCGGGHPDAPPVAGSDREAQHLIELHGDQSMDYFSSIKTGFLQEKTPKGWYDGWQNRWIVLQENQLSCFEGSPRLDFLRQFKLRKVFSYEALYLFRIVSRSGATVEMRVRDQATFNIWLEGFSQVPFATIIRHKELVENSPSAVLLVPDEKAPGTKGEWLQTKIEGYDLLADDSGAQYANFAIQVKSSAEGTKVIYRRYSEFSNLHRHLRKIFPHEQIPAFPGTRMWNKFDATYLKDKTVRLHGYLGELCKRCVNTRGQELLLEFLGIAPPNLLSSTGRSSSGIV